MNTLRKACLAALLPILVSAPVFGASVAVEHLHSLDKVRVIVTAPVYEPIPGVSRKEVEHCLEKALSLRLRDGGFLVSDEASAEFLINIDYVKVGDEMVLLVQGQLIESAELDRKWAANVESVRVVSWHDDLLIHASPDDVSDELKEAANLLAIGLIEGVQEARSVNEQTIGDRSGDPDDS